MGRGARKLASEPAGSTQISPEPESRRAAMCASWRDEATAALPESPRRSARAVSALAKPDSEWKRDSTPEASR